MLCYKMMEHEAGKTEPGSNEFYVLQILEHRQKKKVKTSLPSSCTSNP